MNILDNAKGVIISDVDNVSPASGFLTRGYAIREIDRHVIRTEQY